MARLSTCSIQRLGQGGSLAVAVAIAVAVVADAIWKLQSLASTTFRLSLHFISVENALIAAIFPLLANLLVVVKEESCSPRKA